MSVQLPYWSLVIAINLGPAAPVQPSVAEQPVVETPAGSQAGSTDGAQAGSTAGTQAGSTNGAQAGSTAGAQAGSTNGAQAGSTDGAQAGSTDGAQAGSTDGAQAGSTDGAQAGSTAGPPVGSTPAPTPAGAPVSNLPPRTARTPVSEAVLVGARQTGLPPVNAKRKDRAQPRYLHPPLPQREWETLVPGHLLLNLQTGDRVCVYATALTATSLYYLDPKGNEHKVSRASLTALHENSWECTRQRTVPLTEWALPGTVAGISLSGLSLAMGILFDVGRGPRDAPTYNLLKPYQYAILGLPTGLLGPPVVAFAGRSASRDFRVRGVPWARYTGWALFSASAVTHGMWLAADFGDVTALQYPGHTVVPALLSLVSASILAYDSLTARKELRLARRRDATPTHKSALETLQLSVSPMVTSGRTRGLSMGFTGRF